MKLYTTESNTRLFAHNERVSGLKEIRVDDIKTAVLEHGEVFTLEVLIDMRPIVVDELGELKIMGSDYPDDSLTIDFTKELSYAEIAKQMLDCYEYESQVSIINELGTHWRAHSSVQNGDIEDIIHNPNGIAALHIHIDHYNELVETTVMNTNDKGEVILVN